MYTFNFPTFTVQIRREGLRYLGMADDVEAFGGATVLLLRTLLSP